VLSPETLAEMRHPQVIADLEGWTRAWGLGLVLSRRGERILHGHAGAMPGFLASLVAFVRGNEHAGAVVMTNTSAGVDVEVLAVDLLTAALRADPREPAAWRPVDPPPPEMAGILGRWWSEGNEFVFRWRDGHLEASPVMAGALRPEAPAVFEPIGADRWTTVSGREEGELLRAVRAGEGTVRHLYWAGYPCGVPRWPGPYAVPRAQDPRAPGEARTPLGSVDYAAAYEHADGISRRRPGRGAD
jgi:hypothetical protein